MMCPPARLLATTTRVFTARANNGRRIEQRLGATDYSGRVRVLQFAARMRLARTLIGMVHLPPLPGSPRWDGSMERAITAAVTDATVLIEGGMDALLVENYGDVPFTPGRVEPSTVAAMAVIVAAISRAVPRRSEEHTSELQSLAYIVCRLLLEKKN